MLLSYTKEIYASTPFPIASCGHVVTSFVDTARLLVCVRVVWVIPAAGPTSDKQTGLEACPVSSDIGRLVILPLLQHLTVASGLPDLRGLLTGRHSSLLGWPSTDKASCRTS
jgi:hypothetical protein